MLFLALAIAAQAQPPARPAFEVASVKDHSSPAQGPRDVRQTYGPKGVNFILPLLAIISEAYNFPTSRIRWPHSLSSDILLGLHRDGYDVVANADRPVSKDQLRLMLQSLLADRFKLALHRETKTIPVYRMVAAKSGARLEKSDGEGDLAVSRSADGLVFRNAELFRLAGYLSSYLDRLVIDETGLEGLYNYVVKPPSDLQRNPPLKSEGPSPDSLPASRFADALRPLGLQLLPATGPVEYLAIDGYASEVLQMSPG